MVVVLEAITHTNNHDNQAYNMHMQNVRIHTAGIQTTTRTVYVIDVLYHNDDAACIAGLR